MAISGPKLEVLYHVKPYFYLFLEYIHLHSPYTGLIIYGRYLQFRCLKGPLNQ